MTISKWRCPAPLSASRAKATTAVMVPPDQERQVEEQLEGQRAADDLGQVGRDRDELGLPPEPARRPGGAGGRGTAPAGSCPVATPALAERYWMSIAIRLLTTTTQTSR